jgi:hypothetical protein
MEDGQAQMSFHRSHILIWRAGCQGSGGIIGGSRVDIVSGRTPASIPAAGIQGLPQLSERLGEPWTGHSNTSGEVTSPRVRLVLLV